MRRGKSRVKALAGVVISLATLIGFAGCGRSTSGSAAGGGSPL